MHPLIRFCTLIKFCILFIDYSQMKKARHSRAFFIWRWRTTGEACKAGSARSHTSRIILRRTTSSPGADVGLRKCRLVNRNNVCKVASTLFLWHNRRKEKALQKESAVKGSFAACGRRPRLRALDVRRLLKKAGENFQNRRGAIVHLTFLPTSALGEIFTFR